VVYAFHQKIQSLHRPKIFSIRSVLLHVSGVTDELGESGFFDKIIDFSEMLEK